MGGEKHLKFVRASVGWIWFAAVALFFLCLKAYSLHWQVGDENIYLYMAWAFRDHGALPYRDYFFAHPPLHLLPGIPVFALLGFTPATARLIPAAATLLGALFLHLAALRHGRLGAVVSVFLYLTAFSLLRASTHWTGINLTVMWCCAGLWAVLGGRPLAAGICFALGVGTGNYLLPGAVVVAARLAFAGKNQLKRYLYGFVPVWLAVQLLGLVLGGSGYVESVYLYHMRKPAAAGMAASMMLRVFCDNLALFLCGLLSPLAVLLARTNPPAAKEGTAERANLMTRLDSWFSGREGLARFGVVWAAGYLLFIAALPRVFPFYLLLVFPGLALASAAGVQVLWIRIREWKFRLPAGVERKAALKVAVLIILAVSIHQTRPLWQRALLPRYVRRSDVPMKWSDAPLPGWLNGLFKALWWHDVARAYTDYGTVTELLFHESRYFEKAEELGYWIWRNTSPGETVFGDSSVTGLLAILSGRTIQSDFVDTNTMRFRSGITPAARAIEKIDAPSLKIVVVSAGSRRGRRSPRLGKFASLPEFRRWLGRKFHIAHHVRDRTKGLFLLFERNGNP
ncbi:MAG: hypothetical protein D6806_06640 [Deltaproteobacteria bacterium]|nr:MAG: hypothetical protein D6806_06640 [Deltaproteobacteria bacterium]